MKRCSGRRNVEKHGPLPLPSPTINTWAEEEGFQTTSLA